MKKMTSPTGLAVRARASEGLTSSAMGAALIQSASSSFAMVGAPMVAEIAFCKRVRGGVRGGVRAPEREPGWVPA